MNADQLDFGGTGRHTQQDDDGEQSHLVGLPNIHDRSKPTKWNDGTVEETPKGGVTVHVDKKLEAALRDADQERVKELQELKALARKEEQKEVEELMSKAQPAIPAGWDYLILPRKINLLRVKTPPTIMQEDYFKPVKSLVSEHILVKVDIETGSKGSRYHFHNRSCCYQSVPLTDRSACLPLGRDDHLVRTRCG